MHTLSNEAMYQKTWSSFVDGAISKHQRQERGGCAEGERSVGVRRFELRDVMCLEEVLAKLENAEGGWIDYESRPPNTELRDGDTMESESRQPPQNTPGLPPMFENPRPSFFASMYGSPGLFRLVGKEGRPPLPSLDSQRTDPSVQIARNPSFSGSPGTTERQRLTPRVDSPDGGGTGADMSAFIPMSETEGTEVDGSPKTAGFDELGGVVREEGRNSNNSRIVLVSGDDEDRGCPASFSTGSEVEDMACPISPESPQLAGPTVPPNAVECSLLEPSQHGAMQRLTPGEKKEMHKSGGLRQRAPSSNDCGIVQAAAVEASEDQLDVATAEGQARICQNQEGDEKGEMDRFLEQEEERQGAQRVACFPGTPPKQPGSYREDVMLSQLSARLDATHIDEAEEGDGSGSLATGLDEHLPQDFPRPRELDYERKVEAAAAGSSGGGGGQAQSDRDLATLHSSSAHDHNNTSGCYLASSHSSSAHDHDNNNSFRSGQTSSSPASLRTSDSTAKTGPVQAGGSTDPGISRGSSGSHLGPVSPEGPRREPGGDEDNHASAYSKAESPEMLRLGSASQDTGGARHRDASFDRGSWGEGAAAGRLAGGDVRCNMENNNGAMFSVVQSPDGAPSGRERDSRAFGSMLSPAVGEFDVMDGVGGDGVGSLSPLALARSLDESGEACGGDDDGGCRCPFPGEDRGDYGGLSPVMSARSESSTVDFDGRQSPSQQTKNTSFAEEAEGSEGDEDEDITLTPEVSRSSGVTLSQSRFAACSGESLEQGEDGDSEWRNMAGAEGDGSGLMLPPPPRQPSLSPRREQQQQRRRRRQPENPEARRFLPHTQRARSALADRTNTSAGHHDKRSRDEDHASPKHSSGGGRGGGGGGGGCGELIGNVSIGSFSESEAGESRLGSSLVAGGGGRDMDTAHDESSLVEGTPRRQRASPRQDLGGFYPPLQVSNIVKQEPQALDLSTLQRSTLRWMLWREGSEEEEGEGGRSMVSSTSDDTVEVSVKGGVLGHLSSEEASKCVHALLHGKAAAGGASREKADRRARPAHAVTGLPCGATLIIATTKEAAWRWSNRLESGVDGLSVLSYVMPLRERRRLSAKQAAAFDVVVTTYDVLKAKEVPRGVEVKKPASPRSWALPGSKQWRTRNNAKEEEGKRKPAAASKTDHMVSLLHGLWWDRVVADGAQILGSQRSARAVAALALVGTARWCVVERESMAVVENTSERMRCLTAFLRIPAEVAMVQAAEKLFYHSRPGHVAPLHPREPGAADNSLSLSQVDAGQSSPGSSHRSRRPPSSRGVNGDGRRGKPAVQKAVGLSALQENGGGAGAREGRGSRSRSSSRVGAGSPENGENERHGGGEGVGGRAAARVALSRGDVEYKATTLRLRRAPG